MIQTIGDSARPRFNAPFNHPTDVAVAQSGDIYVADGYGNSVVHRLSSKGELKKTWGGFGTGPGKFMTPHGINISADGRLFVGDRENHRVQIFDLEGNYQSELRGCYKPMAIYIDPNGTIYVTDQRPRVTEFNQRGEITGACKPALSMPHGITGDKDGNIYIIETRNIRDITKLEPVQLSPFLLVTGACGDIPSTLDLAVADADEPVVGWHHAAVITRDHRNSVADRDGGPGPHLQNSVFGIEAAHSHIVWRCHARHAAIGGAAERFVSAVNGGSVRGRMADHGSNHRNRR